MTPLAPCSVGVEVRFRTGELCSIRRLSCFANLGSWSCSVGMSTICRFFRQLCHAEVFLRGEGTVSIKG